MLIRAGDSEQVLNALGDWRSQDFKEVKCGLRTNWFRGGAFTGVPANFSSKAVSPFHR